MEPTSLDSILDEKPVAPEAPVETTEVPSETIAAEKPDYRSRKQVAQEKEFSAQGLERDPATGQYLKKVATTPEATPAATPASTPAATPASTPAATPHVELTAKEKAFYQDAVSERKKRQALEARIAELEKKDPPKAFWDDPEGAINTLRAEISQTAATTKLQTAEAIARGKYPDFDEKLAAFSEIIQQTPGVMQQCVNDPNPAEFAYRLAKNHIEFKQVGSMEEMRAKIERDTETRVRAILEKEYAEKAAALEKTRAALPGSLSDARSTGVNRPVWSGPTSLENILGVK